MTDIIVIGAGSGGLNIAMFMNEIGFKVLLIDKSDQNIGGDCLNFGCVPSKALIHISKIISNAKESEKFGLKISNNVNLKKVMNYVTKKQEVIRTHENALYFRKLGIDVQLGEAKFTGKNSVSINGKEYSAKKIVLATGSRPKIPTLTGINKVDINTNETIFSLSKLPKKLMIIGGGPIGMELGQAFKRLGSKVTIIDRNSHFLPKESSETAEILRQQLVKEGIKFHFNSQIKEFKTKNKAIIINKETHQEIIEEFDTLLISAGRVLNIEGLDLDKANIKIERKRIKVDQYLRTTNKRVFCVGDIAGSFMFTHAAEVHAGIVLNNFFSPKKKKLSYDKFAWVTYTDPQIATFGLTEDQLRLRKIRYEKLKLDFKDDDRAIVEESTNGLLILYISKNKILGGTMIGKNAGELTQELILANTANIDIKNIFGKVYPYPTASRVNKKIISNHFSKKLSPLAKKILKFIY